MPAACLTSTGSQPQLTRRTTRGSRSFALICFTSTAPICDLPFIERKRRLARLSEKSKVPNLFFVDCYSDAAGLFLWCERLGLEGIVSKRANSPYRSGKQRDWRKVKCAAWRKANSERWRLFEKRR
jgi:ATP-dependent DNA ligase